MKMNYFAYPYLPVLVDGKNQRLHSFLIYLHYPLLPNLNKSIDTL